MLALPLAFSNGIACCAQRNWPVRLTASVRSQSTSAISSHAAVGPAMPALLTSASRPPNSAVTRIEQPRHRGRVSDVALGSAQSRIALRQPPPARAVDIADEHSRPFPGECVRRGETDARRTGGHKHSQSGNLQVHAFAGVPKGLDWDWTAGWTAGRRLDYNCRPHGVCPKRTSRVAEPVNRIAGGAMNDSPVSRVVAASAWRGAAARARDDRISGHRPQPVRRDTPRPSDTADRFSRPARRVRRDGREPGG